MVQQAVHQPLAAEPPAAALPVRPISSHDLKASLAEGYADFLSKRGDLIFVGLLYPLIGIAASIVVSGNNLQLLFPLLAGLLLLGPLVATGFYELARRSEYGLDSDWRHFFDILKSHSIGSIIAIGSGLLAIFAAWLGTAAVIYTVFFGPEPPSSFPTFFNDVFTTAQGWGMIGVGLVAGFIFAVFVLAVSVVSLPMLVDRPVSAERAVATSLAAFRRNPGVMLRWGAAVAAILVVASIPAFIGLAAALPILGYATWHLYTRVVDRRELERGVRQARS